MRRRVLFVARTRYRLPLAPGLARKWEALAGLADVRVLAAAAPGSARSDGVFSLARPLGRPALDGPAFYLLLPLRVARELRRFRPDAVVAQSPYEGAAVLVARALVRSRAKLVLDVHGDWRTFTRLYGSRLRRLLDPLADRIGDAVVRAADGVRTVSGYTTSLVRAQGVEPAGLFPAYMELDTFLDRPPAPLPERPRALFVGVLERYKNVDGLAAAWRRVAQEIPNATLHLVGTGTLTRVASALVEELPGRVDWDESLPAEGVARALDAATALVLPSRSEGMGRVLVEALCRGRPVVGARVGGIPDVVEDGVSGLLVPPGDIAALAAALVRVLSDGGLAARLAEGAAAAAPRWTVSAEEFAARQVELVEHVLA
ncbi:MAG TPA: glycosyltransferase family 4 protein [Gaiellaceae bacterium]|nr:glycosyltransferase family 4 protein [Gaiellaceae bacterium]